MSKIENSSRITRYSSGANVDISKTILSDPVNRWIFRAARESNTEVFIVGGYVRDLLRGISAKDRDFILDKNIEELARKTAGRLNGTLIALKDKETYRVVLKNNIHGTVKPQETLDFTCLKNSIYRDLNERDFTIDAIAGSRKTGIVDTVGGIKDLNAGMVKAVRMEKLKKDPVRMLRAYRIAAELGFRIDRVTRGYIKKHSKNISVTAKERITEELFKLLSNINGVRYLKECYKDGLLANIMNSDDIRLQRGVRTERINIFKKNVKILDRLDRFLTSQIKKSRTTERKKINNSLNKIVSQGLNVSGLLRLAILLKNIPITATRLRVGRTINKAVNNIHNGLTKTECKISEKEVFKIFNQGGDRIFETAVLLAFRKKRNINKSLSRAKEYQKIENKKLLNGNDIQWILGIKQGIRIGKILEALREQQHMKLIKTKAEARKWLMVNFT